MVMAKSLSMLPLNVWMPSEPAADAGSASYSVPENELKS